MFLIIDEKTGRHDFYGEDPREQGYKGSVAEVDLLHPDGAVREGEAYQTVVDPCLGRSRTDPTLYQIFLSRKECLGAGCEPLDCEFRELTHWSREQE